VRFVLIAKVKCFISGRDLRRLNVPRVLHGRGGDTEQVEQDLLLPQNHQVEHRSTCLFVVCVCGDTEQVEQDLLLPENHQVVFNCILVAIGFIGWPFKMLGGIYWYLLYLILIGCAGFLLWYCKIEQILILLINSQGTSLGGGAGQHQGGREPG